MCNWHNLPYNGSSLLQTCNVTSWKFCIIFLIVQGLLHVCATTSCKQPVIQKYKSYFSQSISVGNSSKHPSLIIFNDRAPLFVVFVYNFPVLKRSVSDFLTHGQILYLHKWGNYTEYSCVIYAIRRENFYIFHKAFHVLFKKQAGVYY